MQDGDADLNTLNPKQTRSLSVQALLKVRGPVCRPCRPSQRHLFRKPLRCQRALAVPGGEDYDEVGHSTQHFAPVAGRGLGLCHPLLATVLGPGPGLAESLPGVRCLVNRKGQGFAGG